MRRAMPGRGARPLGAAARLCRSAGVPPALGRRPDHGDEPSNRKPTQPAVRARQAGRRPALLGRGQVAADNNRVRRVIRAEKRPQAAARHTL